MYQGTRNGYIFGYIKPDFCIAMVGNEVGLKAETE
jgi:hypothetical protein